MHGGVGIMDEGEHCSVAAGDQAAEVESRKTPKMSFLLKVYTRIAPQRNCRFLKGNETRGTVILRVRSRQVIYDSSQTFTSFTAFRIPCACGFGTPLSTASSSTARPIALDF